MANNRMYLRCLHCGDGYPLAKWYPTSGWFLPKGRQDQLNAWFDEHDMLSGQAEHGGRPPLDDEATGAEDGKWYELIYESDLVAPPGQARGDEM